MKRFIGILLDPNSPFDQYVLTCARNYLETQVKNLKNSDRLSQRKLAAELGIDNNRMNRLTKALEIKELFE